MKKGAVNNFENATHAVSEPKALPEGKVFWELRGWKDPKTFQVLMKNATCQVDFDGPHGYSGYYLRFSLKEEKEIIQAEESELVYLSLEVSRLIRYPNTNTEKYLSEEGLTANISVDYLNEKLEVAQKPTGYHSLQETCVSFYGPNSLPSTVTLMKQFILLHKSRIVGDKTSSPQYFERPEVLRFGITVNSFNCSNSINHKIPSASSFDFDTY